MEFAEHLQPTRQATLIENQGTLADMIIDMAKEGRRFDSLQDLRNAAIREGWRIEYRSSGLRWENAADPSVYFRSLEGEPLSDDHSILKYRGIGRCRDLVCNCDGLKLRTRFSDANDKADHETLVDLGN